MGDTMPKAIEIEVNGKRYPVQYDPETPLLYVLRDELGLTGSKYGCGEGQCGACTVLIGGAPRSASRSPRLKVWRKTAGCIPCSRPFSTPALSSAPTAPPE